MKDKSNEFLKNLNGLSDKEVILSRENNGSNELAKKKKESLIIRIFNVFKEPMFLLLIIAASVYFIVGEYGDGILMLIFVIAVCLIEFIQESKTDKALKELNVEVSELLNGEENKKSKDNIEQLLEYNEITKKNKFNIQFKLVVFFYVLSILLFLFYLRFEYDPNIELNYFIRLFIMVIASIFVIIGNTIYGNNYVEKNEDKKKVTKLSQIIVFIYYIILLFNMVIFARYNSINSYNLIPFKSIIDVINNDNIYPIIINIFGNLMVFMPLEYFIIELFKVKKFKFNFALSVTIILLIELFQFVFKVGVLDIDDLIICTFGMMLFYACYNLLIKRNKEVPNES